MRHYIYISLMAIASVFCFAQASGQALTRFGGIGAAGDANDTTWASTQLVLRAYANNNPNLFATFNSSGAMVLGAVSAGADSSVYVTISRLNDSLYGVLRFSDSVTHYVTPSQLQQAIAGIIIPTWQQTLNQGRTGDSVLISDNLYVGTTENAAINLLTGIDDSRGVPFGVESKFGYLQRVTSFLGWQLRNLSISASVFSVGAPLNPYGAAAPATSIAALDYLPSNLGTTDTIRWIVSARGYNEMAYNGGNYTPALFSTNYRRFLDTLFNRGMVMSRVIVVAPKYNSPTSYTSQSGNPAATQARHLEYVDTARAIAAAYGCRFFNAYSWELTHGGNNLFQVGDSVHESIQGHAILAAGLLNVINAPVVRNDEEFAVNGTATIKRIKYQNSDTTDSVQAFIGINRGGYLVQSPNYGILNASFTATPQGANFNINGVGRMNTTLAEHGVFTGNAPPQTGISSITGQAVIVERNTIDSRVCSTNVASYLGINQSDGDVGINRSSDDGTSMDLQVSGSISVSQGISVRGTPTFVGTIGGEIYKGSDAVGLIIESFNRVTSAALPITIGSYSSVVKVGHTASFAGNEKWQLTGNSKQTGSFNVNDNLLITNAGVFTEYKNAPAALNRIIIGNGTIYDTATLASGTNTIYSNTGGVVSWSADTTNGATKLATQGDITRALAPYNQYTGWAQYIDNAYTVGSPFVISSTTTDTLENNSGTIINSQLPIDAATELYVSSQKKIRAIDTFDSYIIEVRFTASSSTNFDHFDIGLDIGGSLGYITKQTLTFQKNAGQVQEFKATFSVFSGATFIQNGAAVKITANGGNLSIYDINYLITRTHKAR